MAKELTDTIQENAQGPADVSGDSGSMKQHPLKDQIEADQVTSPMRTILDDQEVDGIRLDSFGNPMAFHVLNNHPGGSRFAFTDDFVTVPAPYMVHVFRQERPGPHRAHAERGARPRRPP